MLRTIAGFLKRLYSRLGIIPPSHVKSLEEIVALYERHDKALKFLFISAAAATGIQTGVWLFFPPSSWDHATTTFWGCLIILLADAMRMQNRACYVWMEAAKSAEIAFLSQNLLVNDLIEETSDFRSLATSIAKLERHGWMWSLGKMNTSARTGALVFLWKPEVQIKDGKSFSIVHKGEGDTVFSALSEAMIKAGFE